AALKQSQHVLGSLADKIDVPNEFVTAIETALGHHLQLVLTEQPEAAQEILADLGTNKKGRASIAPLSLSSNGGASVPASQSNGDDPAISDHAARITHHVPHLNGAPLEAIRVVQSDSYVRPLLDRLLGTTRVVRDLPAATAAWRENAGAFHYVTLTGEV